MDHEDNTYMTRDVFYKKGLKIARKEHRAKAARERRQLREGNEVDNEGDDVDDVGLLEGKLKHEQLKKDLFIYLDGER